MTRQLFDQACAEAGVTPTDPLIVPTREALKEAAAAGLGIGVLLDGELGADPRLCHVPIRAHLPPGVGTYALALGESATLPAVAAFLDLCAGS
ncbi:MAG: hypothetical protein IPJ21_18085 [Sterolibacteriaceae bacterium]|nr:hypothetical protein [Sterolibacteriaceae bacterium]MBK9085662.1 hypothetical protein [Sterolibacteriaceae bacterium]